MILGSLVSYYEALAQKGELNRPGRERVSVGYAIYLRQDGSVRAVVSLKKEEVRGEKTVLVSPKLNVPEQVVRTSGKKPNFMCDTAAFLLGLATKDKQAAEKYEKAKALHLDILGGVDSDAARTVCRFLRTIHRRRWRHSACRKGFLPIWARAIGSLLRMRMGIT